MNVKDTGSTHSLTGRLALFFTAVSLVIGLVTSAIFSFSLQWSEDRVGERRILIDKDYAVERYNSGETGTLKIDSLTTAYDDIQLVPDNLRSLVEGKTEFLGETGEDPLSRMAYVGNSIINGQNKTIILLSDINSIELTEKEFLIATFIVVAIVSILLLIFGIVLFKLSQVLIAPINTLSEQLGANSGDTESPFFIKPTAAIEFKQFAERLNQYRDETNALIKREQAFARYASHELRTPLTIVQGANKLLQKGNKTEFQQRQLQRIADASQQMTAMVDALLSLVRYEKHRDEVTTREFTEKELRTIVENNYQYTFDKSISMAINFSQPPLIKASPAIMNMVVGNLLRNAIAATKQGKIELIMDQNSLTILDNGEGLHNENASSTSGHGLGLLIVDELCQRYQWKFHLTERPARGCQAKIYFME